MYNTYMSKETFDNLTEGDEVTVRSLDDLMHDFGDDIDVPCGWDSDMNKFCGETLIVDYIEYDYSGCGILYAKGRGWSFSRQMLEPKVTETLPQEEISRLWEEMILGTGEVDEER